MTPMTPMIYCQSTFFFDFALGMLAALGFLVFSHMCNESGYKQAVQDSILTPLSFEEEKKQYRREHGME